jgi:DNA-directed RNA polymerase subunit E'/Rpb7
LYRYSSMNKQADNKKIYGVFSPAILTHKVMLSITEVGKTVKQNLERDISYRVTGKCIAEGIVKPNSVRIINYSSGSVRGDRVEFQVMFECMVCHPVEGMLIECTAKTITKAGIHAEVVDEDGSVPVTVFIARDHHFTDKNFANVVENDKLVANVIGVRFELNDPYICVIAKLLEKKQSNILPVRVRGIKKPALNILED